MSDDLVPVSGRTGPIRVDVSPGVVPVVVGSDSEVSVDVTNDDYVIRSLTIAVLGLDPSWVRVPPEPVALFPGERRTIVVICRLPHEFPSGARRAAIEVRDSMGDLVPALVEFDLLVDPVESMSLSVEPSNVTASKRAAFTATVANHGNTPLEVSFSASDPEQLTRSEFTPPFITVYPKTVGVTRVESTGKRPWMGAPQIRLLTVVATSMPPDDTAGLAPAAYAGLAALPPPATAETMVAVVQRPRFGRRLLTLLGLLVAVAVFTLVIASTFGNLARKADANAALLKQSLGGNETASGAAVAPAQMLGTVTSSTGTPLSGVSVEVFDSAKGPSVAAFKTVTDSVGGYRISGVGAGKYRIKFSAAGFTDIWYPSAAAFDQGKDIEVAGKDLTGLDAQIVGQPAIVKGSVTGPELLGATVTVRIPAADLPPVDGAPSTTTNATTGTAGTGPVVQTVAVDAAGKFVITDLPTPSDFELTAELAGYTSRVRNISLEPGQTLSDIVLDLVKGDGQISGTVVDSAGLPVGGATVVASDGTNSASTVTLSTGDGAGTFQLLNLITPGTYSIAASAPGYLTTNVTVRLDAGASSAPVTVALKSSEGHIGGTVTKSGSPSTPFGGVTVTVTGPDFTRTTTSLTAGAVGTWDVTGVPLPGTYTVTFSATGYSTQAVGVELSPAVPDNLALAATLAPSMASIAGRVVEATGGAGIAGVNVQLAGPGVTRTARSADQPLGAYGFSNLPPGAYTITFQRTGSADLTLALNLVPGLNQQGDARIELPSGIYGHVTVNGNPYAGAQLKLYLITAGGPAYPFDPPTSVVNTDANGDYVSIGIPPGNYLVDLYVNGVLQPPSQSTSVSPGTPTEHVDFTVTTT